VDAKLLKKHDFGLVGAKKCGLDCVIRMKNAETIAKLV
jgi:hypothetical protein